MKIRSSVIRLSVLFFLSGCGGELHTQQPLSQEENNHPTVEDSKVDHPKVEDVRWVYMSPPLPSFEASQPLFPDTDREKITQLLDWIQQSQPVQDEKLTVPRRSQSLHLVLQDGKTIDIEPAWTCKAIVTTNGSKGTTCSSVENKLIIHGWNSTGDFFADSEELYTFVTKTNQEWMPKVPEAKYPSTVKAGSSFTIEGNAWLTGKVMLDLTKGNQVIWSTEAVPDHGHFSVTGNVPEAVDSGDYDLNLKSDQGRRGFSIRVIK